MTTLHDALLNFSTIAEVKEILESQPTLVNEPDDVGRTPIFFAKTKAITELLIKAGANFNHADREGNTPLVFACNKPVVATTLIKAGADVNAHIGSRGTVLQVLISQTYDAADPVAFKVIKILLANGGDPMIANPEGKNAIDFAIDLEATPEGKFMVHEGCKISEILEAAIYGKEPEIVSDMAGIAVSETVMGGSGGEEEKTEMSDSSDDDLGLLGSTEVAENFEDQ